MIDKLALALARLDSLAKLVPFRLVQAQSDYYQLSLEQRVKVLKAENVAQLCKALIMQNTAFNKQYQHQSLYPKYICVVTQYIAKFNTSKLQKFIKDRQNSLSQKPVSKKWIHYRLCKQQHAYQLTGYQKNQVCPLLLSTKMPIIISKQISELANFFLGAGHVQLKIQIGVQDFKKHCGNQVLVANLSQ